MTSEILTDELRGAIISPSISERANASAILKMRGSRQVPWSNGHSEPGAVEARHNGAAGITLRSSDLNGEGLVGETRRATNGLNKKRNGWLRSLITIHSDFSMNGMQSLKSIGMFA